MLLFSSVNFEPGLIHKNVRKTASVKDDPSPVHVPQCVHYIGGHRKLLCSLKPQMRGMALSQKAFKVSRRNCRFLLLTEVPVKTKLW